MFTPVVLPSREERLQRRRQLRQRRRIQLLKGSWRFIITATFLGSLTVLLRQPHWRLQDLNQVQIEGNQLLTDEQILARLELELPATLWEIQPQAIEDALLKSRSSLPVTEDPQTNQSTENPNPPDNQRIRLAESPFRAVLVQRQLVPAGLIVYVEERMPVALSTVNGIQGFVDAEGVWLASTEYPDLAVTDLPTLQVVGWAAHPPQSWSTLLQAVSQSTLKVNRIDWQVANALILETEVGKAYLGPLSDHVDYQVQALNQMHNLEDHCQCSPSDIEYIDLSTPQSPTVRLTLAAAEQRWGSPLPPTEQ